VFLPVRDPNRLPLNAYVRYYLTRALPFLAVGGGALLLYPLVLKRLRRRQRAEWAGTHGAAGRVAVAYCGLRDQMIDLALPGRGTTPLELVELVAEDEEHAELAWLATRGLWGDLRGALTDDDAVQAERLAASVAARVTRAQPETARFLAAVSRASLRVPYSREVPNVWHQLRWRPRLPRLDAKAWARRLRPGAATAAVLVLLLAIVGGCSSGGDAEAEPVVAFPTRLAPATVAGLATHEEDKAGEVYVTGSKDRDVIVSQGKVVSFSRDGLVQAALQVAQLKPGYRSNDAEVSRAIARSVGKVKKIAAQRSHDVFALTDGTQRIYLWFPTVKSMALLVVRAQVTEGGAEALARGLIDYGDGQEMNDAALAAALTSTPEARGAP
jgi:hypothetical protein